MLLLLLIALGAGPALVCIIGFDKICHKIVLGPRFISVLKSIFSWLLIIFYAFVLILHLD